MGNDYQNPVAEDMDEFGKVGVEMSYIQSQMHPDCGSAKSIADSHLEDGELRKMLASPLYLQGRGDYASSRGKTEAVRTQEREASAQRTQAGHSGRESFLMSSSSRWLRARGKPDAMFSSGSQEPGNQLKSIYKHVDPWNLGRYILEGNKDHVLSQGSELMKQDTKLDLSIIVSVSSSNKPMLKNLNYGTYDTDMLNLD